MFFLVVAYDVVKNRKRARLRKRLNEFLPAVQKSVFEGPLPDARRGALFRAVAATIDAHTDTVRVYHLCAACREKTRLFGRAEAIPEEVDDCLLEG